LPNPFYVSRNKKIITLIMYPLKLRVTPSMRRTSSSSSASGSATNESSSEDTPLTLTVLGRYARGELPRKSELSDPNNPNIGELARDQTMVRRRIKPEEKAEFVPGRGLVGSEFAHIDEEEDPERPVHEERAILVQNLASYEALLQSEFRHCFEQPNDGSQSTSSLIDAILDDPSFGEQAIVKGADSSQLSVGDIFEVEGGLSQIKIELSSPRHTCYSVDQRCGTPYGMAGIHRYALTHSLGGWFGRILVGGELRDGMRLVRTAHPHPKWTLEYLSTALYCEGDRFDMVRSAASWNRSIEELQELSMIKQLGYDEWGEEVTRLLNKTERGGDSSSDSSSVSDTDSSTSDTDSEDDDDENGDEWVQEQPKKSDMDMSQQATETETNGAADEGTNTEAQEIMKCSENFHTSTISLCTGSF